MHDERLKPDDITQKVDACWMNFLGLVLREGISRKTVDAMKNMEIIRLQAGLPGLEEISGCSGPLQ